MVELVRSGLTSEGGVAYYVLFARKHYVGPVEYVKITI
jgi:hypothetical protein